MSGKVEEIRDELLGREFETKNCGKCFIIDYKNYNNVTVIFYEPFCVVRCNLGSLQKGHVSNPMFPTLLGKGYIGVGRYNSKNCGRIYTLWRNILRRCYCEDTRRKFPTYAEVTVCPEWLDFQNFAEWCYSQKFFNAKDDKGNPYQIDKDILVRGNKVYSPEFCRFVPSSVNNSILTSKSKRGAHPIGVYFKRGKFFSQITGGCSGKRSTIALGSFDTEEEAFQAYKRAKEAYIAEVANKWEGYIDLDVYESLLRWSVNKWD